ncbi:EamA family transporter [Streptomyces sp. NPDC051776]|uniref:EamA family transporter n=1 Tax=Streptomyces sp. NPDC051776 TaxID=3155414 RepID=UPI00344584A5
MPAPARMSGSGGPRGQAAAGMAAMAAANVILGASSLYWHGLAAISPATLLGYRILASLVALIAALALLGRIRAALDAASDGRLMLVHVTAAVLVSANWLTFIWGSIHGRVIETGVGYLIAPAVTIGMGSLVLRERLGPVRALSLGVCLMGVGLLMLRSSELVWWVYVTIGVTWGLYTFLKKLTTADPVTGLTLETAVLAVATVGAVAATSYSLAPGAAADGADIGLLAVCGLVSVTPLWLISFGSKKIMLTVAGFLQYLLPTTQFVIAFTFYGQRPSGNSVMCFAIVWLALISLVVDSVLRGRRAANGPERRLAAPAGEETRL